LYYQLISEHFVVNRVT